jgi:hypothetical protein
VKLRAGKRDRRERIPRPRGRRETTLRAQLLVNHLTHDRHQEDSEHRERDDVQRVKNRRKIVQQIHAHEALHKHALDREALMKRPTAARSRSDDERSWLVEAAIGQMCAKSAHVQNLHTCGSEMR